MRQNKIERNVERDKKAILELEASGWNVIVVWECQLKAKTMDSTLEEIERQIKASNTLEQ